MIGGGYTGVSAARDAGAGRRSRDGARARDARRGGIHAQRRVRAAGVQTRRARLVQRLGAVAARDLYDASRAAVRFVAEFAAAEAPDCEYHQSGHLLLAAKPAHYAAFAREREVLAKVFQHETELVPPTGCTRKSWAPAPTAGALLDPLGGGINPAKLFWALAASARRAGARLVEQVEVQHVRRATGVFMLRTNRGDVMARDVIVATNGYSGPVVPALRRRVVPVGSYLIATAPLGASVARAAAAARPRRERHANLLSYFRISADTRMLFGGRVAFGRCGASTAPSGSSKRCARCFRASWAPTSTTTGPAWWR